MNAITKTKSQVPTNQNDPYAEYGRTVGTDTPFLKFVKGEFRYGVDNEVLPLRTRLVPHMSELKAGFIGGRQLLGVRHAATCATPMQSVPQCDIANPET